MHVLGLPIVLSNVKSNRFLLVLLVGPSAENRTMAKIRRRVLWTAQF